MILLILAVTLIRGSPGDSVCSKALSAGPESYRIVDSLLTELRRRSFPELAGVEVTLNQIRSPSDYFTSGTELRTIWNGGRKRSYLVYVNPRLYRDPPSRDALLAVMAHELGHIVDYERRSATGLAGFTVRYLTRDRARYERETDLGALRRGYGCGLIDYREWLYRHVSPAAAAAKRRDYLTPAEIRAWLINEAAAPSGRLPG